MSSKYEVIKRVYETKNISQTAMELNYTQSAVSQIIKNFERELGIQIFRRSKNGMELIPYAEDIMACIENICSSENRLFEIASDLTCLEKGHIRIGSIQSISYNWLPDILELFSKEYPNIKFELTVDGFDQLKEKVEKNELDCIFISEYAVPNMEFIPLYIDDLVLVMPRDHRFCETITPSVKDLDNEEFILSADGLRYETGQIFRDNHIKPVIKYSIKEDFAVIRMVEKGFGISILSKLLFKNTVFNVCIRNFAEGYKRKLGIAYSKDYVPSPAVRKLIEHVKIWSSSNL